MLHIAICDDEPDMLSALCGRVRRFMELRGLPHALSQFARAEHLLADGRAFDIVLMDIRMDGVDGMRAARDLRARGDACRLVFITALKEYVFDAFSVEAADYLVKPVSDQKLYAVLDRIAGAIAAREEHFLVLRQGPGLIKLPCADILYGEVSDHRVLIRTMKSTELYSGKLDALEKELTGEFFRCHRSYLLNPAYVKTYCGGIATLANGERIPVARRRHSDFVAAMLLCQRKAVR